MHLFDIPRKPLVEALQTVGRAITKNIGSEGCYQFMVDAQTQSVTLMGTNIETTIVTTVAAAVSTTTHFLVERGFLDVALASFLAPSVSFTQEGDSLYAIHADGPQGTAEVQFTDRVDDGYRLPRIEEFTFVNRFIGEGFGRRMNQVMDTVQEESGGALSGIHCFTRDGQLYLESAHATEGITRICLGSCEGEELDTVLVAKAAQLLGSAVGNDTQTIQIYTNNNHLAFLFGTTTFFCHTMGIPFIQGVDALYTMPKLFTADVDVKQLKAACRLAMLVGESSDGFGKMYLDVQADHIHTTAWKHGSGKSGEMDVNGTIVWPLHDAYKDLTNIRVIVGAAQMDQVLLHVRTPTVQLAPVYAESDARGQIRAVAIETLDDPLYQHRTHIFNERN